MELKSSNSKLKIKNCGKFNKLSKPLIERIHQFLTPIESINILTRTNKFFFTFVCVIYKKQPSLQPCIREMKKIIKSIDDYRTLITNHSHHLEETLGSVKNNFAPFTFYRSIYLFSLSYMDLTSLDLQRCNIGADGVFLLEPLIIKTRNLNHLNLSFNNIEDEGCRTLSRPLKLNVSLNMISLEGNSISDEGIIYLCESIVSHKLLKSIKFALNIITIESVNFMANVMDKTRFSLIQNIDFKYNNLTVQDETLIEFLRKNKITY